MKNITREAPIRGTIGDYQDWLVEQIEAGVDPSVLGCDINDYAWTLRVVRRYQLHITHDSIGRSGLQPFNPKEDAHSSPPLKGWGFLREFR